MASRRGEESLEEDQEVDVKSLVSRFERSAVNSTGQRNIAQRHNRSFLTENCPPKSNIPDNTKKETWSPGLESRDSCSQRSTLPLPTEQGTPKSNETIYNRQKVTSSPGLDDSNKGYVAQTFTRSLLPKHGLPKSNKLPDDKGKKTRSTGMEISPSILKGKTSMTDYESLEVFQKPLCLIETGSDGKLQTHGDVLSQIREIYHPLNIICIAGPYRTGKSYLLTRLAGFSKGFALGSTIQSKTKGIWVWCRPHPFQNDQILLLLDTEGLGDIEKGDRNNDNQILALGILLSSTMVYNILGKFSKDDLDKLSFVTEISKNIQFADKMDTAESSGNFDSIFPVFIVTLRDFTLELEYEGDKITSDEYLEKVCLKLQPDTSPKNCENNRARICLMEYFMTRKCFTFDTPGGRKILSKLEDVKDDELNKDFVEDTKRFTDYVYTECPPKQMSNGHLVNGRRLVMLMEKYVDSIRGGKVPNVEDALATMVHLENTRAVEESLTIYLIGMNQLKYPTADSSALSTAHDQCFDNAIQFFKENSMYDEENKYYERAVSQIDQEYNKIRTRDQQESEKKSQEALQGMNAVIEQNVKDGRYSCKGGHQVYQKDMKKLETDYNKLSGLGCKKTDMLNTYKRDNASRGNIILTADNSLTAKEKEMEAEAQKVAEAQRQQEEERRSRLEQERLLEEEKRRNIRALEQLQEKYEKERQIERENMERLQSQRREEMERLEREGRLKEAERINHKMEKTEKELSEYHKEGVLSLLGRAVKKLVWWQ